MDWLDILAIQNSNSTWKTEIANFWIDRVVGAKNRFRVSATNVWVFWWGEILNLILTWFSWDQGWMKLWYIPLWWPSSNRLIRRVIIQISEKAAMWVSWYLHYPYRHVLLQAEFIQVSHSKIHATCHNVSYWISIIEFPKFYFGSS